MVCKNERVTSWVDEVAGHLTPKEVVWVDGSSEQYNSLCQLLVDRGSFTPLNQEEYPNSYWYISDPSDVARVEGRTYICSESPDDAGPTNNWGDPKELKDKLNELMAGCMAGRTMYVIPYMMGPDGSPHSKVGFELTDSPYVVVNMYIMSRVGEVALKNLGEDSDDFVRGIHSLGTLNAEERYICHFPETRSIISFNSGYGGNALLGKKCHALRIASVQARDEGWMAEHMLIVGITNPAGEKQYICAAFPSACGKTNLAMLVPPQQYLDAGWKVETVGDDIAWLHFGEDGRLYAVNPEAGFFGVAPRTAMETNPSMMLALKEGNCIFTNTALNEENMTPWWEGADGAVPQKLKDWNGNEWTPDCDYKAAHPNSRFTCPANQCPTMDPEFEGANGVPISAIVFGGRRAKAAPLVYETFNWQHGTFVGATMASEMTAAAAGQVGTLRRDPMAMKPFIGYHAGDYFKHWLDLGKREGAQMPKIFHVNWFRTGKSGDFLWPGFGDNMRVLEWIFTRVKGEGEVVECPLGHQPRLEDLNLNGLDLTEEARSDLLAVRKEVWAEDVASQAEFFQSVGDKLPSELWDEHNALKERLGIEE